jgi:hypothetical protein
MPSDHLVDEQIPFIDVDNVVIDSSIPSEPYSATNIQIKNNIKIENAIDDNDDTSRIKNK